MACAVPRSLSLRVSICHRLHNGGDLFKLQRMGGWKSQAMVQRYAHLAPDEFIEDDAIFKNPTVTGERHQPPDKTATVISKMLAQLMLIPKFK